MSSEWGPNGRATDLARQGFMRPLKVRAKAAPKPTVACEECLNWHPKGQHTASPEVRKARRDEAKANGLKLTQREIRGSDGQAR